ncbi:MAG: hypothetical protein JWQ25_2345 [Daejeonella sp.]|nr:hypothetical protein [Daejeonella sp.]
MIALLIGISSGLLVILIIKLLKHIDEQVMYGLILSVIGFLYVGFTWMDVCTFIISAVQSIVFLFIAYYGIKKSMLLLAGGYFLHGIWDIAFTLFPFAGSIPPHYDVFCLSIDFTMGIYLVTLYYRRKSVFVVDQIL